MEPTAFGRGSCRAFDSIEMNRLDAHRRSQRFTRLQRRAVALSLALGFAFVLPSLIARVPWRSVSAAVTTHGPLVNIVLTAALVIITAFYAFVTSATLKEMRVGRAAENRPLVKIRLGHFVVRNDVGSSGLILRLEAIATFANYGRGTAVDLRAYLSVPSKRTGDVEEFVSSQIGDGIPALEPGRHLEVPVTSHVHRYPVSSPDRSFFEVDASFEDVEANLYQIKQFYDLYVVRGVDAQTQEWRCHLCFEDLRYILFRPGRRARSVSLDQEAERLLIERS
jgi:hypothetical protein